MDYQPRPRVRQKKSRRDRLIRWAAGHPTWVLGFADETWWSRLSHPTLCTWVEDKPLQLVERSVAKDDPEPKALACYGLLRTDCSRIWLRFVDGRPVSTITTQFLGWCSKQLEAEGKDALLLCWDNATWHVSREVKSWLRQHNQKVKETGVGVRIIVCQLPVKSPWLNPIEPHWVHGKRAIVEPNRLLSATELAERVCAYFNCTYEAHLTIPNAVA